MHILIAEDDPVSRRVLEANLHKWGYQVSACSDGIQALAALQKPDSPQLAVLDWMMPGMDGAEVCRHLRDGEEGRRSYLILLTAKASKEELLEGFEAGVDDYIVKPFHSGELRARLRVGQRILELQRRLADRVDELEEALSRVRELEGLLPICSYCRKIRDDGNYWQQIETYITARSKAQFTHSICPDCYESRVEPEFEKLNTAKTRLAGSGSRHGDGS